MGILGNILDAAKKAGGVKQGYDQINRNTGQDINDNMNAVAAAFAKDLKLPTLAIDESSGVVFGQLDPASAGNLRKVLNDPSFTPQDRQKAFGTLNVQVDNNDNIAIRGMKGLSPETSTKLREDMAGNPARTAALQAAVQTGDANAVHNAVGDAQGAGQSAAGGLAGLLGIKTPTFKDPRDIVKDKTANGYNSNRLGDDLPNISFKPEDGEKVNGRETVNFAAKITPDQAVNFDQAKKGLTPDEKKAALGSFETGVVLRKGEPYLVFYDMGKDGTKDRIAALNDEKGGSKKALKAMIETGDVEQVKAIVKPLLDKGHQEPAKKEEKDIQLSPRSDAGSIDFDKLYAERGLKAPSVEVAQAGAPTSGVTVAKVQSNDRGVA